MRLKIRTIACFLLFVFSISNSAFAEIPQLVQYQGKATDKAGIPISGTHTITFRIYDAVTDGSMEWEETHTAVPIENGLFSVLLGGVTPLDLPFDEPYWLSIEIDSDGEMAPRSQLTSVPYAYRAADADHAEVATTVQIYSIPHYITGCELKYVDPNNFRVLPGSIELDGEFLTRSMYSDVISVTDPANWLSGSKSPEMWIYVYLGEGGGSWVPKVSSDPPDLFDTQGYTQGTLRYRQYGGSFYRCVGVLRTGSGGDIIEFEQDGSVVYFLVGVCDYSGDPPLETWVPNLQLTVPAISRSALVTVSNHTSGQTANSTTCAFMRPAGSSGPADGSTLMYRANIWDPSGRSQGGTRAWTLCSADGKVDYYFTSPSAMCRIYTLGFSVAGIR